MWPSGGKGDEFHHDRYNCFPVILPANKVANTGGGIFPYDAYATVWYKNVNEKFNRMSRVHPQPPHLRQKVSPPESSGKMASVEK